MTEKILSNDDFIVTLYSIVDDLLKIVRKYLLPLKKTLVEDRWFGGSVFQWNLIMLKIVAKGVCFQIMLNLILLLKIWFINLLQY